MFLSESSAEKSDKRRRSVKVIESESFESIYDFEKVFGVKTRGIYQTIHRDQAKD